METKNKENDNKKYFEDLKKRAQMELFNLEKSLTVSIKDIDIVKKSLKNMIFYADKKLNPTTDNKKKQTTSKKH